MHSLADAGLVVQLRHDGHACPDPKVYQRPLTVIDVSGIHKVNYSLCSCISRESDLIVQLMRAHWFPATALRPRTVVTLRTLHLFHALTIQGKVNAYDFYNGLVRITDGVGLSKLEVSSSFRQQMRVYLTIFQWAYNEFSRAVRIFRHIRMAKRAGRMYDPTGIQGTTRGGLALACPACPIPGVNLPSGWENAPLKDRYQVLLRSLWQISC